MAAMRLLWSPWKDDLFQLLSGARASVDLAVAYMSLTTVSELLAVLPDRVPLRVLTRIDHRDFTSGVADPETFRLLVTHPLGNLRVMPNLHAKLYVVDGQTAILGSGNLTRAGLGGDGQHNEEAGLFVDEPSIIRGMCGRWNEWWQEATPVDHQFVEKLSESVPEIPERPQRASKIERAISDLLAPARTEPGMQPLFAFTFKVRKAFLNPVYGHVKDIPKEYFQRVVAERLTDEPYMDVFCTDGSTTTGNIRRYENRGERYRLRVYCSHPCPVCALDMDSMLRIEVRQGTDTVRVDLRLEEGS